MVDLTSQRSLNVLMLPWLAHGHIFPFLELAKKLAQRNFHIYFCSTPVNLNSIKPKLFYSDSSYSNSIQLVELHLPSFPELPPHYHTTKGLPPNLMPILEKASNMSRPNITNLIQTLRPDLIIHDYHVHKWVPRLAFSLHIPSITFLTNGVAFITCANHYMKKKYEEFPFSELCTIDLKEKLAQLMALVSSNNPSEQHEKGGDEDHVEWKGPFSDMVLMKSFRELEGKYMDYLYASFGTKIIPVGPLVPDHVNDHEYYEGMDIINWLDKKDKRSTVFVSFGSECYLSKEDMEEMAHGLELSKVNFIWVVRFPEAEKMKLEDGLPKGYLERVRERGMVVENWAPQIKILSHSSIGGFVSHCGWSSVMESIKFGVPIIAMPMQLDQPWNARVAVSSGFGIEVKRSNSKGLERENVAKSIREVVVEKDGEDVRRKATKMSDNLKRKVEEEILDGVEKELLQICGM